MRDPLLTLISSAGSIESSIAKFGMLLPSGRSFCWLVELCKGTEGGAAALAPGGRGGREGASAGFVLDGASAAVDAGSAASACGSAMAASGADPDVAASAASGVVAATARCTRGASIDDGAALASKKSSSVVALLKWSIAAAHQGRRRE